MAKRNVYTNEETFYMKQNTQTKQNRNQLTTKKLKPKTTLWFLIAFSIKMIYPTDNENSDCL